MVERSDRKRRPEDEQQVAGGKVFRGEAEEAVGQLLAEQDDVRPDHAAAARHVAPAARHPFVGVEYIMEY